MHTTAHALEFSFAAEAFNLTGETITAAAPTTAGPLPDFTQPAAELLPAPTAPANSAPWFSETLGDYLATIRQEPGAHPYPFRFTLTEPATGRAVAGGYEATAQAARTAAADMADALTLSA